MHIQLLCACAGCQKPIRAQRGKFEPKCQSCRGNKCNHPLPPISGINDGIEGD